MDTAECLSWPQGIRSLAIHNVMPQRPHAEPAQVQNKDSWWSNWRAAFSLDNKTNQAEQSASAMVRQMPAGALPQYRTWKSLTCCLSISLIGRHNQIPDRLSFKNSEVFSKLFSVYSQSVGLVVTNISLHGLLFHSVGFGCQCEQPRHPQVERSVAQSSDIQPYLI